MNQRTLFSRYGQLVGLVLVGLGLLVIALGWYGASGSGGQVNHAQAVSAQLPYLLSGGFLGLAIVVLGVGILVVHAQRTSRDRMEELVLALAETRDGGGATGGGNGGLGLVVAGTASYHTTECRLVAQMADEEYLTPDEAALRGLRPCRLCKPAEPSAIGSSLPVADNVRVTT